METPGEEEVGVCGVEVGEATAIVGHFIEYVRGGFSLGNVLSQ